MPDPHLCEGTPVLGREGPATDPWWTVLHLVESVVELWQVMELLVSFMEEEVFMATAPSNWVEVSLPRPGRTCPARPPLSATAIAEATGPTQEGPISGPWHGVTHHYWGDRHACCFFPGEGAAAVPPWAPGPSTWVCRNCPVPCRERREVQPQLSAFPLKKPRNH